MVSYCSHLSEQRAESERADIVPQSFLSSAELGYSCQFYSLFSHWQAVQAPGGRETVVVVVVVVVFDIHKAEDCRKKFTHYFIFCDIGKMTVKCVVTIYDVYLGFYDVKLW